MYVCMLYGNRVLRVSHYRRAVAIAVLRYMETALLECRIIGGLSQFQLRVIWQPRSESTDRRIIDCNTKQFENICRAFHQLHANFDC